MTDRLLGVEADDAIGYLGADQQAPPRRLPLRSRSKGWATSSGDPSGPAHHTMRTRGRSIIAYEAIAGHYLAVTAQRDRKPLGRP